MGRLCGRHLARALQRVCRRAASSTTHCPLVPRHVQERVDMTINEEKLNEFIGQFVTDFGAAMHAATVVIGDKLGLYKALAEQGPATGAKLAAAVGLDTRLVEEWLNAQFVS